MSDNLSFDLNDDTYQKILQKKDDMGFKNKSWNEWFLHIAGEQDSYSKILEKVFFI